MPFCPKCKYEFVEGMTSCPDCQVDLVEKLPEEEQPGSDFKWVVLHAFPGPVYAEMVKETLQRHDIPCLVKKDFFSSAYGAHGTSAGGLETVILVPEERREESEHLLVQMLNHI
ncbi:MAG: DUF2007 domain-containing protein [Calditrichaeota bacterium]|nr:MAG: DUF2007 domain-containing protein [Calditrichota bacterium]